MLMQIYLANDGSVSQTLYEVSCPAAENTAGMQPVFLAQLSAANPQTGSCPCLACFVPHAARVSFEGYSRPPYDGISSWNLEVFAKPCSLQDDTLNCMHIE